VAEASPKIILEISGLTRYFGGLKALSEIDLKVSKGSIHSVIGPNGAGKSTLFNIMIGMYPPSKGSILLEGKEITGLSPRRIVFYGISKSFQITNIFFNFTVRENLRLACQVREHRIPFFGRKEVLTQSEERTDWLLETLGLEAEANMIAGNLSHGKQRSLEIGIALATKPRVLLLDEPTAGMTSRESLIFAEFIQSLRKELTLLMIEHDMEVVMGISDTITVLHYGEKIFEGSPEAVRSDPQVQAIYFGKRIE
jgi:branched-chain amino acid transport system ATP-binding protein